MKTNKNISRTMKLALALSALLLLMVSATLAVPKETDPIWRVQLRVQTADVSDAGTDDNVRMALNFNNNTWLDYGRDDFPRNNTFTYDLKLDHVATIADLSHIYLEKTGSDGLALKYIALIVNGRTIYDRTFYAPLWLDNDGGNTRTFVVDYTQLRQDNAWRAYTQPFPPFIIDRAELESRIESVMGDVAYGNRLQWGHKYGRAFVEATKAAAPNTIHVDLDMELDIPYYFNPEVDIDFDLLVSCANNQLQLKVLNSRVYVDSDFIAELLSLNLISILDGYVQVEMNKALKGINLGLAVGVPFCPVIEVKNVVVNGQTEVLIEFKLPSTRTRIDTLPPITATAAAARMTTQTTEKTEAVEDGEAPLTVGIETADSFKTADETPYTLNVKSQRQEAGNVTVQIALPPAVIVNNTVIEVEDENGARTLALQTTTNARGETVLSFQDWFAPGADHRYRLQLRFLPVLQADWQLVTTVSDEAGASLKSTTHFQLNEGTVTPRGTYQAAQGRRAAAVK